MTTAAHEVARPSGMSFAEARVSVACDVLISCIEAEVTGREGGFWRLFRIQLHFLSFFDWSATLCSVCQALH